MSDRIRRVGYRTPQHEEVFDEVFSEFSPVEAGELDKDVDVEEVEDSETFTRDKFRQATPEPKENDDFEFGRIRERGWKSDEIDFSSNTGVEFAKESTDLQTRMNKYSEINQLLNDKGINRRYVVGKVKAPDSAYVFEDNIGKYYYDVDTAYRPSDVTKVVDEDSWFEIPTDKRGYATTLLLGKAYPWHVFEAKDERSVSSLLERALITEVDDLESEDVFSMEKIEEVKDILLNR